MSLLSDLQAERAKYGATLKPEEVGALLNAVAWKNRAQGWGMLQKNSGNSVPLRGLFISGDTLIDSRGATEHFDVLRDWEGVAEPVWNSNGPCVLGPSSGCEMKRFVAPFDPVTGKQYDGGVTGGGGSVDLSGITAKLDALAAELATLKASISGLEDASIMAGQNLRELDDRHSADIQGIHGDIARIDKFLAEHPIPTKGEGSLFGLRVQVTLK